MAKTIELVEVSKISVHPLNVRKYRGKENIARITESIKQRSMEYPIKVVRGSDGGFLCYDGGFRLKAAKLLGTKEVPVIVEEGKSELELVIRSFDAEDKSVPLTPIEEAEVFDYLSKHLGSLEEVTKKVGRHLRYVKGTISLLHLINRWKKLCLKGKLGWLAAYRLSKETKRIQAKAWGHWQKDEYHSMPDPTDIDRYIGSAKERGRGKWPSKEKIAPPTVPINPPIPHQPNEQTQTDVDWVCPRCDTAYETYHLPNGSHAFKRRFEE